MQLTLDRTHREMERERGVRDATEGGQTLAICIFLPCYRHSCVEQNWVTRLFCTKFILNAIPSVTDRIYKFHKRLKIQMSKVVFHSRQKFAVSGKCDTKNTTRAMCLPPPTAGLRHAYTVPQMVTQTVSCMRCGVSLFGFHSQSAWIILVVDSKGLVSRYAFDSEQGV